MKSFTTISPELDSKIRYCMQNQYLNKFNYNILHHNNILCTFGLHNEVRS